MTPQPVSNRFLFAALVCIGLMVGLRLAALSSDAYRGLSWDTGLFTDEGYYLHNARNVVLFRTATTDDFNNILLMPLLHLVQLAVFSVFGVGAVQARLISVGCSLGTLGLFYAALNRWQGRPTAVIGTLFLGLDPVFLLFNRMALMDTPATLPLTAAFYAFVRAVKTEEAKPRMRWSVVCGVLLLLAYTTRGLTGILVAAPFAALWRQKEPEPRRITACVLVGLFLGATVYAVCWYLPNRTELTRLNHYYVTEQLWPRTFAQFRINLAQGLWGHEFLGLLPYLLVHAPVLLGLSLYGTGTKRDPVTRYLAVWLLLFWAFCLCVNYAPSRYYPLFYPAFAALAASGMVNLSGKKFSALAGNLPKVLAGAWAIVNLLWLGHWMTHLTYQQREADRWLAENLPANSVLFGDVAPGLCLNNKFRAVNMIPKLCNDAQPLEKFPDSPRYLIILDDLFFERWWKKNYPDIVVPRRLVRRFPRIVNRAVAVYDANLAEGFPKPTNARP